MSENREGHHGHGWLWMLWALVAGMGGLVVYAKMKPETEIGKQVNGLCDSLWSAIRTHCRCCQSEDEIEPAPEE